MFRWLSSQQAFCDFFFGVWLVFCVLFFFFFKLLCMLLFMGKTMVVWIIRCLYSLVWFLTYLVWFLLHQRNVLFYSKPYGNLPSAVLEPSVLWEKVLATSKPLRTNPDINETLIYSWWLRHSTKHMLASAIRINYCDSSYMKREVVVGSHFKHYITEATASKGQRIVNITRSLGCAL